MGDTSLVAIYGIRVTANLNPEKALIFRITHISNVGWIMQNGLHCANSEVRDPRFVQIGNPDLIDRRRDWPVGGPYGGTLSDYVPFYFTPFSPMLLNIVTGYGGIVRRRKDEIAILVSSIWRLRDAGVEFVISDRHALVKMAQFSSDPASLERIDWELLRRKDFKRDPDDPGKVERYEAEALAKNCVPHHALVGVYAYNDACRLNIEAQAREAGREIKIITNSRVFF